MIPGMFSRSGARQSHFDDRTCWYVFHEYSGRIINDEQRDNPKKTPVTRQGTLSSYVYAKGVLAVGGYRRFDGEPATYSSAGRQNDGANGPDLGGGLGRESRDNRGSCRRHRTHVLSGIQPARVLPRRR